MSALLLTLSFAFAEEDAAAKKLFDAIETKLAAAKSVKLEFTGRGKGADGKPSAKGTLIVAQGDKYRLSMTSRQRGGKRESTVICDGKTVAANYGGRKSTSTPPKGSAKWRLSEIGRNGVAPTLLVDIRGPRSTDKRFYEATDFQLGEKEKVGKRETQIVKYKLKHPRFTMDVTVWIDTKTGLPVKRTFRRAGKQPPYTETMTWTLNPKLDEKTFTLPE